MFFPKKRGRKRKLEVHDAVQEEAASRDVGHSRVGQVSVNRRRYIETPPSPQKQGKQSRTYEEIQDWTPSAAYDSENVEALDTAAAEYVDVDAMSKVKRRYKSDQPFLNWIPHLQEFVTEAMRREGRGDAAAEEHCPTCKESGRSPCGNPQFRCEDCFGYILECAECCILRHRRLPLHRVERWTGTHFQRTTLKELGLRVQLGHLDLECVHPERGAKVFTVLHTNGIHIISVDFCACEHRVPHRIQLLRAGWYPATTDYPESCASLDLLNSFHILTLTGKISHWEYYRYLEHMSDNLDVDVPKVCDLKLTATRRAKAEQPLRQASAEGCRQQILFEEFTDALPEPALAKKWADMIAVWERDPEKPNPYVFNRRSDRECSFDCICSFS
ncbi:CxC2 domain-containing protein [Salix suchowensis]|nr:CxC2 domain-containing protein [Salix suchowensis]